MIVKMKSYYLKSNVKQQELKKYGFKKIGDNYRKQLDGLSRDVCCYHDTKRFVFVDYPWREARYKKVAKHIEDLIKDELVELKINYEWWAIIGRWQNYSKKKKDRIQTKLNKLNKGEQR